jgi:lauroyl/myristoyl acyltransferase
MRQLQYLRVLRPGGWRPTLHLEGAGRIDDALAHGRGVILWVSSLVFGDLVTKMGLAGAGIRVRHLSSFEHGFSPTRFGARVLNRLATSGEERFLTERLVMTPDRPTEALRDLTARVRQGGVVSISAVLGEGQRGVTVPFLHGTLTLADGAPQLARRTGAQLLPVFTIRLDDGSFATTIGESIGLDAGSRDESVARAVAAYARELEPIAIVAPDQIPLFSGVFGVSPE